MAARALPGVAALLLVAPGATTAQHRMVAPSGRELSFSEDSLRRMLEATRALRRDLEEDPRILYFVGTGPAVPAADPDAAFPWNAVDVLADSLAAIQTPGNLREADRAYANYAVIRMKNVRRDPDVSCDSLMAREVRAVSAFADGWVVARVLFGGPGFAPLDEVAFAREDGVLPGLLAGRGNRQLGGCLRVWTEAHGEAARKYREWRNRAFLKTEGGTP